MIEAPPQRALDALRRSPTATRVLDIAHMARDQIHYRTDNPNEFFFRAGAGLTHEDDPVLKPGVFEESVYRLAEVGGGGFAAERKGQQLLFPRRASGVFQFNNRKHGTVVFRFKDLYQNNFGLYVGDDEICYPNAWLNVDLRIRSTPRGCKFFFDLKAPGHAPSVAFSLVATPEQSTVAKEGRVVRIRDRDGLGLNMWTDPFIFRSDHPDSRAGMLFGSVDTDASEVRYTFPDTTGMSYPVTVDPTSTFEPSVGADDSRLECTDFSSGNRGDFFELSTNSGINTSTNANTTATILICGVQVYGTASGPDEYSEIDRMGFIFDSSSLPDSAAISAASVILDGRSGTRTDLGVFDVVLMGGCGFGGSFTGADYENVKDGFDCNSNTITASGWNAFGTNTFNISSSSFGTVISKTGDSDFGLISDWDLFEDQSTPDSNNNGSNDSYIYADSYEAGASTRPELSVTYTTCGLPGSGTISMDDLRTEYSISGAISLATTSTTEISGTTPHALSEFYNCGA